MTDRKKLPRVITKEERLARFKGRRGAVPRGKGRISQSFKEALLLAAELEGSDGKGKDGLVGYLRTHARDMPKTFLGIMQKAITPAELQLQAFQLNVNANKPQDQPGSALNVLAVRGMPTEQLRDAVTALRAIMTPGVAGPFKQLGAPRGLNRIDRSDGATDAEIVEQIRPTVKAEMRDASPKQIADEVASRLGTEVQSRYGSTIDKTIADRTKTIIKKKGLQTIATPNKHEDKNGHV